MDPQMAQKSSLGRSWSIFLRFLSVLEGGRFLMRFWIGKKSAKNRKNQQNWRKEGVRIPKLGSPGGMRGTAGGGFGGGQLIAVSCRRLKTGDLHLARLLPG